MPGTAEHGVNYTVDHATSRRSRATHAISQTSATEVSISAARARYTGTERRCSCCCCTVHYEDEFHCCAHAIIAARRRAVHLPVDAAPWRHVRVTRDTTADSLLQPRRDDQPYNDNRKLSCHTESPPLCLCATRCYDLA